MKRELYRVRTDLALESREQVNGDGAEIRGVLVDEEYDEKRDIRTTVVRVESENGARALGKAQGTYITIEAPNLSYPDEGIHREVSEELARYLRRLAFCTWEKGSGRMDRRRGGSRAVSRRGKDADAGGVGGGYERAEDGMKVYDRSILVVGLGNREVTPDALGPGVVENLRITRHILREYGASGLDKEGGCAISALVPGVMAQTGMESLEILKGVVKETKPDLVVMVDALAARSMKRLNRTIQVTNTGVHPGSGVGNNRHEITEKTLGVPVVGIGIPTVVDAATIVYDAMSHLLDALEEREREDFLEELITPQLRSMFVTPKDVDETVKRLSYTISEGIHMAFS